MTTQVRGLAAYCGPGYPERPFSEFVRTAFVPQRRGFWYCALCRDPQHPDEPLELADSLQILNHCAARHQGSKRSIAYYCAVHRTMEMP